MDRFTATGGQGTGWCRGALLIILVLGPLGGGHADKVVRNFFLMMPTFVPPPRTKPAEKLQLCLK